MVCREEGDLKKLKKEKASATHLCILVATVLTLSLCCATSSTNLLLLLSHSELRRGMLVHSIIAYVLNVVIGLESFKMADVLNFNLFLQLFSII